MSDRPPGTLKMAELAERSGVSTGTIKHYLREGLLDGGDPEVVRTSRNMAWYPPAFVERIRLIKRLQGERFMPLRHIRAVLRSDQPRTSRAEVLERLDLPANVLDALGKAGALEPTDAGYGPDDMRVIEAIVRFRDGGYDEALGFTVYDTVRYRRALEPLVAEEVQVLLGNLAEVDEARAVEIIRAGAEPLRELLGALHSRMLLAELDRVLQGPTG